jgi:hypothetical protein
MEPKVDMYERTRRRQGIDGGAAMYFLLLLAFRGESAASFRHVASNNEQGLVLVGFIFQNSLLLYGSGKGLSLSSLGQ